MDTTRIRQAQETVGWLADIAARLPAEMRNADEVALHFRVAQLYLAEYAGHLDGGMSPFHAMVATAQPAAAS